MTPWPIVRLGDCCEIVSGATPRRDHLEYWGGEIAWVTPKDIRDLQGSVLFDTPEKITQEGYASCSARLLPIGSVLFSSRAPIGLVAVTGREMCTNQGFKSLVPGATVDAHYLYWCMRRMGPSIAARSSGTTFAEISLAGMQRVQIPLSPLPEQRRIATILDKADAVRRKRQQTLELADQFLRSAFLDMFGDPVTNPKGWPRLALRQICQRITVGIVIRPASYYRPVGIPALRSQNIRGGEVSVDNLALVSPDDNETRLAKSRIWAGDVVAVRTGQPGSAAVVPQGLDGANAIDILIVTPDKARLNPFYLCQFLNSVGGTRAVAASQRGQIQKHMNVASLQELRLPLPPLFLQERFAAVTAADRTLLEATRTAARQVEQLAAKCQVLGFHGAL